MTGASHALKACPGRHTNACGWFLYTSMLATLLPVISEWQQALRPVVATSTTHVTTVGLVTVEHREVARDEWVICIWVAVVCMLCGAYAWASTDGREFEASAVSRLHVAWCRHCISSVAVTTLNTLCRHSCLSQIPNM
jgi:hypothetical protein